MIAWITIILIITTVLYSVFSMLLGRPVGLFIAAGIHIVLGIISLPSIGWFVLVIALVECLLGFVMVKQGKDRVYEV